MGKGNIKVSAFGWDMYRKHLARQEAHNRKVRAIKANQAKKK